jgi:hypothetical protein
MAAASNSSPPGGMPSLPGNIPGLPPGLGSAPHLQLPGPSGLPGAGTAGLPPGMLNYTSVLSSLASQYAPGMKDEGGPSLSKENASSPRTNHNDLTSTGKNSSSSNRSSTNGKSSKHRPSSNSSHISKPNKVSTAESDGERSESDLVIDTSIGHPKHTNGGSNAGSGLLLPNGIKSEAIDNAVGSATMHDIMSGTPPVSAANGAGGGGGGGGGSSRARRDRSPMSDKDGSQRSSASSSAIKKERNTPQPNKSMTPNTGNNVGPPNLGGPQLPPGTQLGMPPGLAGRMSSAAPFG